MGYQGTNVLLEERERIGKGERTFSFFLREGKAPLGEISLKDIGERGGLLTFSLTGIMDIQEEALSFLLYLLFLRDGKEFLLAEESSPLLPKAGFLPRREILLSSLREGSLLSLSRREWRMSLKGKYRFHMEDDLYPLRKEGWEERPRLIARGLVLDEEGKLLLHEIRRDDAFGKEGYLETPGGGVDRGETLEEALRRECLEELGRDVVPLLYLGSVEDEYRVIGRRNITHFFLAKAVGEKEPLHMVSRGDSLIQRTLALSPREALALMRERNQEGKVGILVRRREEPFLSLLPCFRKTLPPLESPFGAGIK